MGKQRAFSAMLVGVLICISILAPVTVAQSDDWPDNREAATEVSPGTYTGTVDSEDDRDYLKISVRKGDTVTLTLDKEIRKDTAMNVNWPGGSEFIHDESAETLDRKITSEENGYVYVLVGSGTVSSGSESWELTVEQNAGADEWNDRRDDANEISDGTYGGEVNSPDDTDYAKVPVRKGDTVTLTLDKEIRKDTAMNVNWPGGSEFIHDKSAETLDRKVTSEENGYVYVLVGSGTAETDTELWELNVERNQGADEWSDRRDTAREISPGSTVDGEVNSPDDTDYVKVPVREGETLTATLDKVPGRDTAMNVNWPGGSEFIHDESAETLGRKITSEENGYVYVLVGSGTAETDTEPWTLSIGQVSGRSASATTTTITSTTTTTTTEEVTTTRTPATSETSTLAERTTTSNADETESPAGTTERPLTTESDRDGDGVKDSEDYAPDDPDVQEESDLEPEGSTPGFGPGSVLVAFVVASFVALRRL